MTIKEKSDQLVEEFGYFDSLEDKYSYIIDLGKSLPVIDDKYKTPEYTIKGCQSQVWLHADYQKGKIIFTADSDAIITKGIIAMLVKVFSDATPDEIYDADLDFIDKIGLKDFLSPTRSNGLMSMVKQMKMYAYALRQGK